MAVGNPTPKAFINHIFKKSYFIVCFLEEMLWQCSGITLKLFIRSNGKQLHSTVLLFMLVNYSSNRKNSLKRYLR